MNIEIANRLVNLRKSNNLSQEALASKLGISRQAVSKWERAEASPDTDNLILLARLYKVSLDELLRTEDEIPLPEENDKAENFDDIEIIAPEENGTEKESENGKQEYGKSASCGEKDEYVQVSLRGIHVKDKESEVHVGWDGVWVEEKKAWGKRKGSKNIKYYPIEIVILVAYLIIGCGFGAWHPGWLLFLLIPIWHSLIAAIARRDASCFAYPVFAILIYLYIGLFYSAWHPGWIIFLTIPLYYPFSSYINSLIGNGENDESYGGQEGMGRDDGEE